MGLSRRGFIGGLAASGAVQGCRFLPSLRSCGSPCLTLGVLSDIHLRVPGDEGTFRTALEFFRARNVDGVLVAGDITDTGRIAELERCAATWYSVFPDGKYPDGRVCEQLFIYGNHCIESHLWQKEFKDDPTILEREGINFGDRRKEVWERCFHESYAPVWTKTVRGCTVVGRHWGEPFALPAGIDRSAPFVYTQHDHPKDTCLGPWAWGHDDGTSTAALSHYPNCVAFSGNSHHTLTDERSVWQGGFTSVNTGSLNYASVDYSLRENAVCNESGYRGERRPLEQSRVRTKDGRQGLVVSFYDDRLVVERREFVHGLKSLGPDWIVPYPADGVSFSFAARAAARSAPAFDCRSEPKVKAIEKDGRRLYEVSFPPARPVDGCRPNEYEVSAVLCEDDVELVQAQRRVLDEGFYLPVELAVRPTRCVFAADALPNKGSYRFEVRPIECFGKKGPAIRSAPVVLT